MDSPQERQAEDATLVSDNERPGDKASSNEASDEEGGERRGDELVLNAPKTPASKNPK